MAMSLCAALSRMNLSSQRLASRVNGIAAAPKVLKVAPLRATAVEVAVVSPIQAKLKTRKAAAKRYKVTASGKVMVRRAGKQHLNEKMNRAKKNKLSKENAVFAGDVRNNVRGVLPYKKISLQACRQANKEHV